MPSVDNDLRSSLDARAADRIPRWGARKEGDQAVFGIWAPAAEALSIEIDGGEPIPMLPLGGGWFEYRAELPFGTRYRYRLPNGACVPDPASRRQDGGVHGQSVLVAQDDYRWCCASWRGRPWRETVLYELHAGLAASPGSSASCRVSPSWASPRSS
jgi:maltooligosyltrehalose trehalohydrolase